MYQHLFAELFQQDPLPLEGVERLALQLNFLLGAGPTWEAFRAAALAAPPLTQQSLEGWLSNHWNQLPKGITLPQAESQVLAGIARQLEQGSLLITGFDIHRGLRFQPVTEDHARH